MANAPTETRPQGLWKALEVLRDEKQARLGKVRL